MASQTNILIHLFFIIFIVFSCIYCFPPELDKNEDSYFANRHLLSSKVCVKYNRTFGRREPRDTLVEIYTFDKAKKWMTRVKNYLSYNRKNRKPNNTTRIEIINRNKECNCYATEIVLKKGGIYKPVADLLFVSERNCNMNYTVKFYAKL